MAGILDEKDGGILGRVNDFFFKDSGKSLSQNISNTLNPPTTTILNKSQKQAESFPSYSELPESSAITSGLTYPSEAKKQQTKTPITTPSNESTDKDSILKRVLGKEVVAWFDKAGTTWKDSGGFEKLMADPGFLIGLGMLEQAGQGKSIGAGALDSMVKAGAISSAYADRIKARAKIAGPITSAEREQARAVLAESDLGETASLSTKFKNFILGKNTEALNARALDDIAQRARDNMEKDASKGTGGKVRSNREYYENAVKELIKEGKISLDPGFWILGGGVQSTSKGLTDAEKISPKNKRELGGPVSKGTSYLVGEVGPEVFIPKQSGKIVSNDDSKIINLLLEANPQLKNVSPARAEKILRNRFPDYFE